jgi:hypothetical protein
LRTCRPLRCRRSCPTLSSFPWYSRQPFASALQNNSEQIRFDLLVLVGAHWAVSSPPLWWCLVLLKNVFKCCLFCPFPSAFALNPALLGASPNGIQTPPQALCRPIIQRGGAVCIYCKLAPVVTVVVMEPCSNYYLASHSNVYVPKLVLVCARAARPVAIAGLRDPFSLLAHSPLHGECSGIGFVQKTGKSFLTPRLLLVVLVGSRS